MTDGSDLVVQRGYFWWSKQRLPHGCFAPSDCATGTLTIKNDGMATLELDGIMAGESGAFAALANPPGRPREAIQGKLKDGSSALLFSVVGDGGNMSSRGISFQRFKASGTLIGQRPFRQRAEASLIKEIIFNLDALNEWMLAGGIELRRSTRSRWSDGAIQVKYKPSSPYNYREEETSVQIFRFVNSTYPGQNMHEVKLESISYLKYRCPGLALTSAAEVRRHISDFICLLVGTVAHLDKTRIVVGRQEVDFYSHPNDSRSSDLNTTDCFIPYIKVLPQFGPLLLSWLRKRKTYGPAFYVLVGHKRLASNYLENRFSALVSGLEAFSRVIHHPAISEDIKEKVRQIIDNLPPGRNKTWLRKRLRNAAEPNLQQRLFAVFSRIPLGLEPSEMQVFCERCMSLRNDISHFGGPRTHPNYEIFLRDVAKYMMTLELLYHASILNEIGLEHEILLQMIFRGFQSFRFRSYLSNVGFTLPPETAAVPSEL